MDIKNGLSQSGAKVNQAPVTEAKAKQVDIKTGLSQKGAKDNQVQVTKEDQKDNPRESQPPAGKVQKEVEEGLNLNRDKDGLSQSKCREASWTQR